MAEISFKPKAVPVSRLLEVNTLVAAAIEQMQKPGLTEAEATKIVARIDALGFTNPSYAVRQANETWSL